MQQTQEKEITSSMIKDIEHFTEVYGWKNLKVYHGGKVISFEVRSFTLLERIELESLGLKESGLQVYTREGQPFIEICFALVE